MDRCSHDVNKLYQLPVELGTSDGTLGQEYHVSLEPVLQGPEVSVSLLHRSLRTSLVWPFCGYVSGVVALKVGCCQGRVLPSHHPIKNVLHSA